MKLRNPEGAAGALDVISLRNFRSVNISAHTPVVAGSMKPPNTSREIGCPVWDASMVAATGCAIAVAVKRIASVAIKNIVFP
jgi:hypothetical protein